MQELIIHLAKSAGLLSLFYAGYFFLLRKDTAFRSNRFFLLAGIMTSLLLPFLEITRTVEVEATAVPLLLENFSPVKNTTVAAQPQSTDWWLIAGAIYLAGFGFFLLKFFLELFVLLRLIFTHQTSRKENFLIINKKGITQPFSFFHYIVLDPNQHSALEQELILKHEMSHAQQWHSIDQIISSLSVYLLWFNPFSWLYRKSLVQNLEFLADKEVVAGKVSKKEYQKTLLKISVGGFQPALSNQFYQSLIKKRIMMINQNDTQKSHFWKASLLLPFLAIFIFSFNVKTEAKEIPLQEEPQVSKTEISVYVTKESDEKALRAYKRLFVREGVQLKFEDLEFSKGLLTNVKVTFRKEATGTTGNLSLSHPKGISPLLISTNGKEFTMTPVTSVPKQPEDHFAGLGNSPLYILAGKEYKTSQLLNKYVQVKGEWNVLKPEEARQQYGSKARNGAIIIAHENIVEDFKAALKDLDLSQMPMKQTFIQIRKDEAPILMGIDSKVMMRGSSQLTDFEKQDISFHKKSENIIAVEDKNEKSQFYISQKTKPLIVIDGQIQDEGFDLNSIKSDNIKSLQVLKGEAALKKYGERAKNGALEIKILSDDEIMEEEKRDKAVGSEPVPVTIKIYEDPAKKDGEIERLRIYNEEISKSNALYVVNGKEMDKNFDPKTLDHSNIKSIDILKGAMATEKYGEKGKNGVIEIDLKSKEEQKSTATPSEKKTKFKSISASKIEYKQKRNSLSVRDVGSADPDAAKPIYVVDGKEMDKDFDPDKISREDIEQIAVLKGEKATAKYGARASKGVIEITTK